MKRSKTKPLRYIAIAGNALFFLWIVYNGIDEGSRQVGRLELAALSGLLLLLALNLVLFVLD